MMFTTKKQQKTKKPKPNNKVNKYITTFSVKLGDTCMQSYHLGG